MEFSHLKMATFVLLAIYCVTVSRAQGLTQEIINFMATHIYVRYEVLDNFKDTLKTFSAQITLTNKGNKPVPGHDWVIYFCQPNLVEPRHHPYPEGVSKSEQNVKFRHYQGCLFSFEPEDNFGDIPSGGSRTIRFYSENYSVSRTDTYPNWYIAAKGLEPRVIVSTAGESLDWVADFDAENKWKRFDYVTPEAEDHDRYDPYTPSIRFEINKVKDLGGPAKWVIPTPAEINVNIESFLQLNTKDWTIFAPDKFAHEAKFLSDRLGIFVGYKRPTDSRTILFTIADVRVTLEGKELSGPEAYSLTVDPVEEFIEIRASEPEGAFYGVMTLLNMKDDRDMVPQASIVDAPRYAYRGLMLDVARNFHTLQDVLRILDVMAQYKLNKFHFHLTDDEGWRIQIPGLEELSEVAGRRCHDLTEQECLLPFLGSGPSPTPRGSGFYTVEDYQQILRYAAERHIEVIPEIDMPGHGHAAIKAMEARRRHFLEAKNQSEANRYVLVDDHDTSWYKSIQLYTDNAVNPCLNSTYNFIRVVVKAMVEAHKGIMPLKVFHFGGDEVAKGAWENSTACDELFRSGFDFRDFKDLKEYFVRQVSAITHEHDLDLASWEDGMVQSGTTPYTRARLPNKQVYVYAWDNVWEWGRAGLAHKLANAGFQVVMAQATHMYFDHPHEPDPEERGLYWAPRFTDTRKTFSFVPSDLYANADVARSGASLTTEDVCGKDGKSCVMLKKPENIVGVQGHLWSEVVRTRQQADYMMFPRFLALAERAWHEPAWERRSTADNMTRARMREQDWTEFANTLGYRELARLDRQGIEYRLPPPGAKISNGRLLTNVPFPGLHVEYSTNGGATWCDVFDDMALPASSHLQLRTGSPGSGRHSRVVTLRVLETASECSVHIASVGVTLLAAVTCFFMNV